MNKELSGVVEYICSFSWVKFMRSSEQKRVGMTNLIEEGECIGSVRGGCDNLGEVVLRNPRYDLREAEGLVVHQIVQYL